MSPIVRGFVTFATAVATFYFTFWGSGALLVLAAGARGGSRAVWVTQLVLGAVSAWLAAWFVWRQSSRPDSPAAAMLVDGVKTGAIGFCIGFFGPMLLSPGANQGPLLGIFIMGPAGFALGALGGWIRWSAQRARDSAPR